MSKEFKLPELGENIETAGVISVLVKAGDKIEKDQGIIEIETDKATIEVPSDAGGTVKAVLIKEGDQIKVGQTIIVIEDSEKSGKDKSTAGKKQSSASEEKQEQHPAGEEKKVKQEKKKETEEFSGKEKEKDVPELKHISGKAEITDITLPELGENIETADVLSILVKKGDTIEKDQGIIEIETDKATIEVPSTISGKVKEVLIKEGEKAKVGQTLIKVEGFSEGHVSREKEEQREEPLNKGKAPEKKPAAAPSKEKEEIPGTRIEFQPGEIDTQPPIIKNAAPAAPSVRRLARELGVDINKVKGSGPYNRISLSDVKDYVKKLNEERERGGAGVGIKKEPLPDFSRYGSIERKPMSKIRAVTADHLSYAWSVIPHVTQHDKADITELEEMRKSLNSKVKDNKEKVTITGILVMIAAAGLKKFPQFNTSIDLEKHEVIYKSYFNIGIAVDTENGLIVPVVKNVDSKGLREITTDLNSLADKARNRKIGLDDLQGACFTITNLGGIGGTHFTPIVNSPEVAILGVSRGSYEPVYNKKEFVPRLMLPLSLSYDHRIIDGADAARFLRWVCETLEQPFNLILE